MNIYVSLINDTIEFIEDNIKEKITLEGISHRFNVSEFHFNRMFRTVTGRTLKQYILGRKLTGAMECLAESDEPIINIAYYFGFEYPEVFSRAFKKHFGVSPNVFRKEKPGLEPVKKANVVEREIISYQGNITLKGEAVFINKLQLEGIQIEVNENDEEFKHVLQSSGERFLAEAYSKKGLNKDRLYTVVNCHGEENGGYTVFYGMETMEGVPQTNFKTRLVPEGWYESFLYRGDIFDIRESFIDDLYRWVIAKEVELMYNGVGMIDIFEKDSNETGEVRILVPVRKPV